MARVIGRIISLIISISTIKDIGKIYIFTISTIKI
jgi:hypothetical protein